MKSWWTRECGFRDVLTLALPLVISTCLWTVLNFTDRMFLLWYSNAAMAASLPAGLTHFAAVCFPLGIVSYVNTFVAQYHGAGKEPRIGAVVWQGIWLGLFSIPFLAATLPLAPWFFRLAGHQPDVVALEITYYRVLTLGGGAMLINAAFASFFTGRGSTRVVLAVDAIAVALNALLDYAWIFGHWGLPAWGVAGAAWATVVAQWFAALLYWRLLRSPRYRDRFGLGQGRRFNWLLMRRLLAYGGPSGLQLLVEVVGFTFFIFIVGQLGQDALAATNLAFNINSLAWVPMMGLGIAVSTIVGQQLGRNRDAMAARATWVSFSLALFYMGTIALAYVVVPQWFLLGHAAGMSADRFAALRDITVVLLRFVAAYSLFDAMNLIFANAIKGAGDTRFILATSAIMAPLPTAISWWGIRHWHWGLCGCWTAVTVWICTLGVVYLLRFLQGRWRTMRVIEPAALVLERDALPGQVVDQGQP